MANNNVDKPHKCLKEGCNSSFKTKFKLKLHEKQHTGERNFVCNIDDCSKSYTQPSHLRRHKSMVHESRCLDEIMCEVQGCGMVLKKQNMAKHINRVHNSKPFQCTECHVKFKKKRQLHQHLLIHTGKTPFKCNTCNICFGSITQYKKHIRNHKTYICDCGEIFDRWSMFQNHRKSICTIKRVDHKCIICNKIFTTSSNLKVHSLTHVEESLREVYKCQYLNCTRSYKYKKNLDSHIREFHENRKPVLTINCTYPNCSQILSSKKNLKQHLHNIHSGLPKFPKNRKPRKDKGIHKKYMAGSLSGINLKFKRQDKLSSNDQSQHENITVHEIINAKKCLEPKSAENETTYRNNVISIQEPLEKSKDNVCSSLQVTEDSSVVVTNGNNGEIEGISLCNEKCLLMNHNSFRLEVNV